MTSATLANLWQADDKSLRKFMQKFGRTAFQIRNLNPEVVLHSMLLALRPDKFADSRTTTKHEQDLAATKRSSIGTTKQTKEEIEQKTEDDRDTNISGASDNLHKNRNPPNISEV
ncbi:hypothetical protein JHK82_027898 [Glycine max]|nr:hypothetical protein JHK85_028564 [Glycine max]KAG5003889.1 hypothetical protein JHK86_028028 [Glycine max]KAG5127063.1 hypothetical protein JHK82_027898 [Glycine max]KAG5151676.1 hypothetical protein JHK84_028148 [Glycine max]